MIENKQERPTRIATKIGLFFAQKSAGSRAANALSPQLLHRVIHTIHKAPVDITVDKEAPPNGEKAQQNQHFKYHTAAPNLYCVVNKPLITKTLPILTASPRTTPIVTGLRNMHRSGAACSLNVTSIGICLSRQQYVVTAIAHFLQRSMLLPLTRPECGTIVRRPLKCSLAREPRVFPGTS
jgi:hypothetical protein